VEIPGPFPKVHEREKLTAAAGAELLSFLVDWHIKHGLTRAEEAALILHHLTHRMNAAVAAERRKNE
jgi:hypothetical protein